MKHIPLTRGLNALVDDEDFPAVMKMKWTALKARKNWYAVHYYRKGDKVFALSLHRFLLSAKKGQSVDHRDGNGLNNQRSNIRLATHTQNMQNRRGLGGRTGFKGVYPSGASYVARITVNKKLVHLGTFTTKEAAAKAYDAAAKLFHGEFARFNFCSVTTT